MTLSTLPGFARFGVIDSKAERRRAEEWMSRLHIKAPSLAAPLGTLSGGNQQKALLARWLMGGFVRVMVLDHPTRGLDIAAKRDVCEIVSGLREEGIAVLLLADSLEELIELSDRIVVMKDGVVKKVLDVAGAWPTPVEIVAEMV
jgi:ribose transport system ATP-binding protein